MSIATSSRLKASCVCGKKYSIRADLAGKTCKCKCGKRFKVPARDQSQAAVPERMCPDCGVWISKDESACNSCRQKADQRASEQLEQTGYSEPTSADLTTPWWERTETYVVSAICAITIFGCGLYQTRLNGPEFLSFYFYVGVFCGAGLLLARFTSRSLVTILLLVVTFEAIGLIRYAYGSSQGMSRFQNLFQMMGFAPFVFLSLMSMGKGSGSGSGGWSGGGCGGGCGGGGCGGCGG